MTHDANNEPSPQPEELSFVPMAERIPGAAAPTGPLPLVERLTEEPILAIPPGLHFCFFDLTPGCYRITYTPSLSFFNYQGTMRVDTVGGGTTVSGDLYQFFNFPFPWPPIPPLPPFPIFPFDIPVYPRNQYYSYLKVTNIQRSPIITTGPCNLTLTAEEYVYTQPPTGSFNGTFPTTPSRTVTIVLSPQAPPLGFTGSYFAGTLYENGIAQGSFTMGWVSSSFRKATLEVHTLTGAATPTAVPATVGTGSEDFRSVYATAGWELSVIYDLTPVPVPSTVPNANVCWTNGGLFGLLASVITPAANLDRDWRFHLLVVPGTLGCFRGSMFDASGDPTTGLAPRQGAVSYSDDGYPTTESPNFGTAANETQRHEPRAFLRSASHEVGHGFNQQHQEFTSLGETGADNSIMTTTPSVAGFLASSGTGTFPDAIALKFNDHVRHHLIHFPDPAVRPGGMTFGVGHFAGPVPQVDRSRQFFSPDKLELKLIPGTERVKLGEPLSLKWQLVNNSQEAIPTPTDIRTEAQHAYIRVVDPHGTSRRMPSFVIQTDAVRIADLKPGAQLEAGATVFWSAKGFAFETPGQHRIEVRILWNHAGIPYGVKAHLEIWVDHPVSEADNEIASTLLHKDVGLFVALGGEAPYLEEAVSRIERAISKHARHPASKHLMEYRGHKYSRVNKAAP